MKKLVVTTLAGTACAFALGAAALFVWQAPAQSQVRASPALQPVGVAGAGAGAHTTAWFHDPAGGRVIACQTMVGTSGLTGVQCVSSNLP